MSLTNKYATTYQELQIVRAASGMTANAIDKGATWTGSTLSTWIGTKLGPSPEGDGPKGYPLSSTTWLCRLPPGAVRWYSKRLAGTEAKNAAQMEAYTFCT